MKDINITFQATAAVCRQVLWLRSVEQDLTLFVVGWKEMGWDVVGWKGVGWDVWVWTWWDVKGSGSRGGGMIRMTHRASHGLGRMDDG